MHTIFINLLNIGNDNQNNLDCLKLTADSIKKEFYITFLHNCQEHVFVLAIKSCVALSLINTNIAHLRLMNFRIDYTVNIKLYNYCYVTNESFIALTINHFY